MGYIPSGGSFFRGSSSDRILWITNFPAPYRIPIWNALAKKFPLEVVFTLGNINYRGWSEHGKRDWCSTSLNKRFIKFNENEFVGPSLKVFNAIQRSDLIIVHGWENFTYISAMIHARLCHKGLVNVYESNLSSHKFHGKLYRTLKKIVLNMSDVIFTLGPSSTQAVLATGISSSKIVELFNPVDVGFYAQMAERFSSSAHNGHSFLYVGQLIERKNILDSIRAFSKIRNTDDSFTIVGSGELEESIRELVLQLGLGQSVSILGHKNQDELGILYAQSDTLVMVSKREVWGLVANEALASGMHVIVSDQAGVTEFIKEMSGVYVSKIDTDSIAESMLRSKSQFEGRIENPQILRYTPELFVKELLDKI